MRLLGLIDPRVILFDIFIFSNNCTLKAIKQSYTFSIYFYLKYVVKIYIYKVYKLV